MKQSDFESKIKILIPTGSVFWYPQFYAKRIIRYIKNPSSLRKVRWHVVYQNILLEDYKAIYFHIPKVACSTLKRVCAELIGIEIPSGEISEEIHRIDFPSVKKYKVRKYYKNYFKFAIVRNPWSRIVSCYNDKINYPSGHVYEKYDNTFISYLKNMKVFSENMSFERFVEIICDIPEKLAEGHFRSQHTYLTDEYGNLLPNFIGRFENLNNDFNSIAKRLDIKFNLPHIRAGKYQEYQKYYSKRSKRMIEKRYKQDIELFGYEDF